MNNFYNTPFSAGEFGQNMIQPEFGQPSMGNIGMQNGFSQQTMGIAGMQSGYGSPDMSNTGFDASFNYAMLNANYAQMGIPGFDKNGNQVLYGTLPGMMDPSTGRIVPPPPASTVNIQKAIIGYLCYKFNTQLPESLFEFVRLSEPLGTVGEGLRHACKMSLVTLERMPVESFAFYDKANVEFAYCDSCFKIIYFFEKL